MGGGVGPIAAQSFYLIERRIRDCSTAAAVEDEIEAALHDKWDALPQYAPNARGISGWIDPAARNRAGRSLNTDANARFIVL